MFKFNALKLAAVFAIALTASLSAQSKSASKPIVHDLTIKAADGGVYTGTMEMATVKGKVTGTLHITKPTEIKAAVEGTSEKGALKLDFRYTMTERNCQGTVRMDLKTAAKAGAPTTGTMEAIGCGRDQSNKLTGLVELVPVK